MKINAFLMVAVWSLVAFLGISNLVQAAAPMPGDFDWTGENRFDTGSIVDFKGTVKILGVTLTPSAAVINSLVTGLPSSNLAAAVQDAVPYVTPSSAPNGATSLSNIVTIALYDLAGNALLTNVLVEFWISDSSLGAPSTNNVESVNVTRGTIQQTVTSKAHYRVIAATNGVIFNWMATAKSAGGTTNHLMYSVNGIIKSLSIAVTNGS